MIIALVSLNQAWLDKNENIRKCNACIDKAVSFGAKLIVFPEMTLTGFSMDAEKISEDYFDSQTIDYFKEKSITKKISIIFGLCLKSINKYTNNAIYIDSLGVVIGNYSKIHPFSFAGEEKVYSAGNHITVVNTEDINIGLTVCYDLRFPELFSAISKTSGLIVNIANWPQKRIDHWNILLKARAIENQIFLAGINRTGIDGNNLKYQKSSKAINPNGDELISIFSDEVIDIVNIDFNYLKEFRKNFSTTQDRKPILYKKIL